VNAAISHSNHSIALDARRTWQSWTIATALGELIGFAVPAVVLPLLLAIGMPEGVLPFAAVFAGAAEGASLGFAQWLVLRRHLPDLSRNAWVVATLLAAMWAYAIAMIATQVVDLSALDPAVLVVGGAALGMLFVLSIGGAQWFVLRHHIPKSGWWVLANAVAWPIGVAMPFVTIGLVPDPAPVVALILSGILGGLLMGLVVGALTGLALVWLLRNTLP
jgi:hypothetical protein